MAAQGGRRSHAAGFAIIKVMILSLFGKRRRMLTGEVARRQHSMWLTRAFQVGREYPRIPVRAISSGGFTRLMTRPGGPALAERWWARALDRVDDLDVDE